MRLPYRADRILLGEGVPRRMGEKQEEMGLYERLLEERAAEEQRRGGPLPRTRGPDSKVLDRRLGNAPKDLPPGYAADLATMHRLMARGVHSPGAGMRLGSLKGRCREEYAELRAEARGLRELL